MQYLFPVFNVHFSRYIKVNLLLIMVNLFPSTIEWRCALIFTNVKQFSVGNEISEGGRKARNYFSYYFVQNVCI